MCKSVGETKESEKIKATEVEIIVRGTVDKPYFEIKYHEVGKSYDNIGFGSYILENVFKWKEECFEIEPVKHQKESSVGEQFDV